MIFTALETLGMGHVSAVGPQSLEYSSHYLGDFGPRQGGDGTGDNILYDYPVFVQSGLYTGVVQPGYAQGRDNLIRNSVHYFIYTP